MKRKHPRTGSDAPDTIPTEQFPDTQLLHAKTVLEERYIEPPDTIPSSISHSGVGSIHSGTGDKAPAPRGDTLERRLRNRAVCVCVDDVGLHDGVNRAALDLAISGRVQALACRVGAPGWSQAVLLLRRLRTLDIDIGLQLDLTRHPINPAHKRALCCWMTGVGALSNMALRAEINAQLDAFEASMGRPPAFVAGHRHVHQLASVRDVLLEELLGRYRSTNLPWVRQGKRGGQRAVALPHRIRAWAVERGGARGLAKHAKHQGVNHNRALLGVYDFKGGVPRYGELLFNWLHRARDGEMLVTHPSRSTEVPDRWIEPRMAEFECLASREWSLMVERLEIDLEPMSRMLARRSSW